MSEIIKIVTLPNIVTGKLRIDPDGSDTTEFGVYSTGTVQKYELGTRYFVDDRSFRYGRAGSDVDPRLGAFDFGAWFADNLAEAAVIGDIHIVITTDATSGDVNAGFGTTNNMVGGTFSYPSATSKQVRRITGHVAAPDGTTVKVYLDGPITLAIGNGTEVEFQPNPYRDLKSPGGVSRAVMGVPVTKILADSFGWFQTWGPTWMVQNAGADFSAAYDTQAVFTEGGNLTNVSNHGNGQLAGFVMGTMTRSGTFVNPPFIFLQISP